jgi:hypothetical protein
MKEVKIYRFLEFSMSPNEKSTERVPKTAIEA